MKSISNNASITPQHLNAGAALAPSISKGKMAYMAHVGTAVQSQSQLAGSKPKDHIKTELKDEVSGLSRLKYEGAAQQSQESHLTSSQKESLLNIFNVGKKTALESTKNDDSHNNYTLYKDNNEKSKSQERSSPDKASEKPEKKSQ